MSNQYKDGTVQLLIRLPKELKDAFVERIKEMNEKKPVNGAPQYGQNSILRGLIEKFLQEPDFFK